ncbi:MAG: helix-turn-helix domain-containing protein [Clostridiaceae bacterium]|nr:helix-turn-helix domain-containing protein [Clostridiaceae bacterium]
MDKKSKQQQLPLLQAETTWFHIFRAMVDNGDVGRMGPHAVTTYLVIKAFTNWNTGKSWPDIETIMEKTCFSKSTVLRALKTLEDNGYVSREKLGRRNAYTLREKVTVADNAGRPAAVAMWDYIPSTVQAAQAELKNFVMTGEATDYKVIKIDTLNLNVNLMVGDHNLQLNMNDIKDDRLRKVIESIETKRKSAVSDEK